MSVLHEDEERLKAISEGYARQIKQGLKTHEEAEKEIDSIYPTQMATELKRRLTTLMGKKVLEEVSITERAVKKEGYVEKVTEGVYIIEETKEAVPPYKWCRKFAIDSKGRAKDWSISAKSAGWRVSSISEQTIRLEGRLQTMWIFMACIERPYMAEKGEVRPVVPEM